MRDLQADFASLRGQVLIAHPGLLDPNFRRSVVLIAEHTADEGAIGVILNRPLDQVLGSLRPEWENTALAGVPVFEGGPVRTDDVLLVAWRWDATDAGLRLYFGSPPEDLLELSGEAGLEIRAFVGHAGWEGGQMEGELTEHAWLPAPVHLEILESSTVERMWWTLLARVSPELALLADAPDDATLN